jgi:hypothetical protein
VAIIVFKLSALVALALAIVLGLTQVGGALPLLFKISPLVPYAV